LIVDPTSNEEDLMTSSITIVMNIKKEICNVYKQGGQNIGDDEILKCLTLSKKKLKESYELLVE
jgi:exosome complex RNA-binding protein Rrp42 (RNase PH superfamily)